VPPWFILLPVAEHRVLAQCYLIACDYKSAKIPLVWVFNPDVRIVRVIQAGHAPIELDENAELTGDAVLPGFAAKVCELFPEPVSSI